MELWFLISAISFSLCAAFLAFKVNLFLTTSTSKKKRRLPPGPPSLPILGSPFWLTTSFFHLEPLLRRLATTYGPIFTLRIGPRPVIFISGHALAHKALIQNGSSFSDRLPAREAVRILTSNQHNINSAPYGPLWRLLRRNLVSEILHPSRTKSFAHGRKWVLDNLVDQLGKRAESGEPLRVIEMFQRSLFTLLMSMCFGQRFDEPVVKDVQDVHRRLILIFPRLNVFSFFPRIGKLVFRKRWNEFLQIRREQEELVVPLIKARRRDRNQENGFGFCYIDSLLDLELPDEGGRKLTESEMVTLCSEFLNGGTDTTSTTLQWIMANLVKHQEVQEKLVEEIEGATGKQTEEDLNGLPYLKAVVMEGLRRHPPGHFVLPHMVSEEEVEFEGYVIPKGVSINFMVAEMGWNEKVWEEPMEFRPERFLDGGEEVDITGSREIKMMPFGAGRRICPGLNLAMLHLEYFVANLVREFHWKPVDGEEIDLSERQVFTTVMKTPLKAKIIPRGRRSSATQIME